MRELTARRAWRSLRRWWWLALLAPLLLGGGTYLATSLMTPVYRADTTLVITANTGAGTSDYNDVLAAERRADTLSQLASGRTVLTQVIAQLGLATTPEDLAREVSVTPVSNTQLLRVAVADPDPRRAATVANAVTDVFTRIVQDRLGVSLQAFDEAVVPTRPISPRIPLLTALGGGLGLLGGLGLGLTLAYLDDTIETPEELRRVIGAYPLGCVDVSSRHTHARADTATDEDYRALRLNLQLAVAEQGARTIMVAGAGPGEGTAEIVARLADAFARAGRRIAVVTGNVGVLAVATVPAATGEPCSSEDLPLLNPLLVATGSPGPDAWGARDEVRTAELIRRLATEHDLVLVDAPSGASAATLALTSAVEGVVVVAYGGRTRGGDLARVTEALGRAGAPLLGAILCRPVRPSRRSVVARARWVPLARPAPAGPHSAAGR